MAVTQLPLVACPPDRPAQSVRVSVRARARAKARVRVRVGVGVGVRSGLGLGSDRPAESAMARVLSKCAVSPSRFRLGAFVEERLCDHYIGGAAKVGSHRAAHPVGELIVDTGLGRGWDWGWG